METNAMTNLTTMLTGSAPLRTEEDIRLLQARHASCKDSGLYTAAQLREIYSRTGIKGPCALSFLPYYSVAKDYFPDIMHELHNLEGRMTSAIFQCNWNVKCLRYAERHHVHPEWLPAPEDENEVEDEDEEPVERKTLEEHFAGM
jgi:hypothetical protein